MTDVPFKILFWTHKTALEEALARPEMGPRIEGESIGLLKPTQITKYKGATRIVVFDSSFFGKLAGGFAHCPTGCPSKGFEAYYYRESSPTYSKIAGAWYEVSLEEPFMFQD